MVPPILALVINKERATRRKGIKRMVLISITGFIEVAFLVGGVGVLL